jgi:hypothetical protein
MYEQILRQYYFLFCGSPIAPQVGIRLQAELLSASNAIGGGAYFGMGGSGASLNSYSSMLQINLGVEYYFVYQKKSSGEVAPTTLNYIDSFETYISA